MINHCFIIGVPFLFKICYHNQSPRIYEGTNEIQKLVIAHQILRED